MAPPPGREVRCAELLLKSPQPGPAQPRPGLHHTGWETLCPAHEAGSGARPAAATRPTPTQLQPPRRGPGTPGCTRPLPRCPHLSLTDWERSPGLGCSSRFLGQPHKGCLQRGKWLPLLAAFVFSTGSTVFHQSFPVNRHVT